MKVIVTGATGTVGSGVLEACLEHPSITSIVALTRRPLEVKNPKINNVIHKDFLNYDKPVLEHMKGAEACIWALGSPTSGKEVHIDYTTVAIKTLLESVVPEKPTKPFRFVYTSGGAVPILESKPLSLLGEWTKLRAQLDRDILDVEKQHPGRWESFVARPWSVCDKPPMMRYVISGSWLYRHQELGRAMVDAAVNGGEPRIMNNQTLRDKGQAATKKIQG